MTTFNVLDETVDIFGPHFLEASAGTGKTFTIENIIPRLLLESSDEISLEDILVVTFTRAATRELKARIYKNLLKISANLNRSDGSAGYPEGIRKQGGERLYQAKRKIEEALCCFEKAQIFTLHGFCSKILGEFAFDAGFLPSSNAGTDQNDLLIGYIKDFLRIGPDPSVLSPGQLGKLVRHYKMDAEALCKALMQKMEKGDKIRDYPNASESVILWNEALASLPRASKEELFHDFSLLAPRLSKVAERQKQADPFFGWIEKGCCSFEEWDRLSESKELFFSAIKFDAAYKKKSQSELGLIHPGLFERIRDLFVPLHESARDESILLLQLANACRKNYEKGRSDLAYFNPDDLVGQLQTSLKEKRFREKVRAKYKAAIIDEFQDTDPLQWDIFETLFLKERDPRFSLYLVGDPKQSIYAFRNADVYVYLKAAQALGEKNRFYLDTNFRSHRDLVLALNELFSFELPPRWMVLPLTGESLEVRRVESKPPLPSPLDVETMGRVHFFVAKEEGKGKKWPSEETEREKLFPFIAKEVLRLQKEKGMYFRDMAVLVKDRYQAGRLREALQSYGIPCLMQKSLDPESSSAYESMKGLLEACVRPTDLSSLKKFLGGIPAGYSFEEIQGGWDSPLLQETRRFFLEGRSYIRKKGFGAFFQDFLVSVRRDETIAEELMAGGDASFYSELRQILQILLTHCPTGVRDPERLLSFLQELKELSSDDEILKAPSEEEEDQVRVMTVHKSKGLEFEIVFALELCSRHAREEEFISVRCDEGERELVVASKEKESLVLHGKEADAEKLRRLYVALTRAKERVYIPVIFSSPERELLPGTASPIELLLGTVGLDSYSSEGVYQRLSLISPKDLSAYLDRLSGRASVSYEEVDGEISFEGANVEAAETLTSPPLLRSDFLRGRLLSFSSLIKESKSSGDTVFLENPLTDDLFSSHALPQGAETGIVIHEILETLCKADLHRTRDVAIRETIDRIAFGTCLAGSEEVVQRMILESFSADVKSDTGNFSLSRIPSSDMRAEMEFLYPAGPSLIKGFIDLVFRYEGRYFILDWKTNYLGPRDEDYDPVDMQRCMDRSGYFLQASIYTSALQKYLALFDKKPFEELFGGVVYFFLRGRKPFFFKPDLTLFHAEGASVWPID